MILPRFFLKSLLAKPIFGSLLVIALGHVFKQIVAGQIDIVNDLAQVFLEIIIGQTNQVVQSVLGNITLPLEFTLTLIAEYPQVFLSIHPSNESISSFKLSVGVEPLPPVKEKAFFVFIG